MFSFLETHKHTHPNKNKTTRSPHQLSPFSDLKEHLLIGKRVLFKNTTDATYTKHTRTDPVCTKTLGCINNDEQHLKKKRRQHAETRGGEKGEEFCGKPKQPTRMLAGLYLFAFYYNVLSLWRTGFEILTDFIRLNTIAAKTDWNCVFREELGARRTGQREILNDSIGLGEGSGWIFGYLKWMIYSVVQTDIISYVKKEKKKEMSSCDTV